MKSKLFKCPYLKGQVELTAQRFSHIQERHPEVLPDLEFAIRDTIFDPDLVRRSPRFAGARIFSKYFPEILNGKNTVVVVVSDFFPQTRHWIITAYITRRLLEGDIEWQKK